MNDRLLIDTNVLIWTLSADSKMISPRAKRALLAPDTPLFVSIASVWEIVLKHKAGKLPFEGGFEEVLDIALYDSAWKILPVKPEHLPVLARLPMLHKDPFDRLLIAQAQHEGLTIATSDEQIAKYHVRTLW